MSNLLREKCALAKLRIELEGRKGKLCRSCKGFGHLAQNCRNKRKGKKGVAMPQNKFEVLSSRVMQCGVEERIVRNVGMAAVECFKCGEKEHKCREYPLWRKKEKRVERVACPGQGKVYQQEKRKLVHLERGKAQECGEKRKVRKMEKEKAVHPAREEVQQKKWKRSLIEKLRKRAEEHCGKGVLQVRVRVVHRESDSNICAV